MGCPSNTFTVHATWTDDKGRTQHFSIDFDFQGPPNDDIVDNLLDEVYAATMRQFWLAKNGHEELLADRRDV